MDGTGRDRAARGRRFEATIGATERTGVWLDRESWERDVWL